MDLESRPVRYPAGCSARSALATTVAVSQVSAPIASPAAARPMHDIRERRNIGVDAQERLLATERAARSAPSGSAGTARRARRSTQARTHDAPQAWRTRARVRGRLRVTHDFALLAAATNFARVQCPAPLD